MILKSLHARLRRLVIVRKEYLFQYPLDRQLSPLLGSEGIQPVVPISRDRLASIEFVDDRYERPQIERHLAHGEQLGVILVGDRVVTRGLVRHGGHIALEADRKALPLGPDGYYIHFCATAQESRGQGLYPMLLRHMVGWIRECHPRSTIWIACNHANFASIRGICKAGFVPSFSAFSIGFVGGRIALTRLTPLAAAHNTVSQCSEETT